MSDQDVIREALTLSSLQRPRKLRVEEGLAALDALVARCEQAERERDEALGERDDARHGDHANCLRALDAEARLRVAERALREIEELPNTARLGTARQIARQTLEADQRSRREA